MDRLLLQARGLYADGRRTAVAAMAVVLAVTTVLFYSGGLQVIETEPLPWAPPGWTQGLEVVTSFNTVLFFLAFSLMVFFYAFWSWAFLPSPAVLYTVGVLRGIFGETARIVHRMGRRFRVHLDADRYVDVVCRVRDHASGEWFVFELRSSPVMCSHSQEIAMRHGMRLDRGCFATRVSHDELHHRTLLMTRALALCHPTT